MKDKQECDCNELMTNLIAINSEAEAYHFQLTIYNEEYEVEVIMTLKDKETTFRAPTDVFFDFYESYFIHMDSYADREVS